VYFNVSICSNGLGPNFRNIYGQGVVPATGSEKAATVQGYKTHHDAHENRVSNLTFHHLQCPADYYALSDFANMEDKGVFDYGSAGCVHRYFLADGMRGKNLL